MFSTMPSLLLALALACPAAAQAPQPPKSGEQDPEAPAVAWPIDPEVMAKQSREFKAAARAAFLDPAAPLPGAEFPFSKAFSEAFAKDISELVSLGAQVAYVRLGRSPEDMSAYADMVVHVAARLGVDPPESALPRYRGRTRPADQPLTPQQEQGFSELTEAVASPEFRKRFLYVSSIYGQPPPTEAPAPSPAKGKGRKRRRPAVQPPPEPKGPSESVLEVIDWKRAEELAAAAEDGADGWNRRTRRRRRGRCYEWVRMALQKTGLWTDDYRSEVTAKGDWKRPRRAYSFAWAMNKLESRRRQDPFADRRAPLRRLDLRVDPLVRGSILVFDRSVCGHNARSGHIEVVSSISPLRASSFKFHEVKLDCLARAANEGKVHIYVPHRLDPYPPTTEVAASSGPVTVPAASGVPPTTAASELSGHDR
ncbi:MAG: hypothetical protein HY926_10990 [Elusimicrobia bacterium]|nr:hypothetical protein [Elusimicrobiota bacterium]